MPAVSPPAAPPGLYYVGALQATVQGWSATTDSAGGFPRAGVDVGGGIHVPPAQSVTTHYGLVYQHPTLSEWAYWSDATTAAALTGVVGLPAPVALDATWSGAVPLVVAVAP